MPTTEDTPMRQLALRFREHARRSTIPTHRDLRAAADILLALSDDDDLEQCCEVMHDAYEQAAVGAGWETQAASRKPWADVPEANKATMRIAVTALLDHLRVSHD